MSQLECILVTPESTVFKQPAEFVALPLYDGEIGIAPLHTPMIGRLGCGELRVIGDEGLRSFYVEGGFVDTGVSHYVIFVQNVDEVAVEKVAPFYRNHRVFPQGVNVDFVERTDEDRIRVRTYERGVEGETLSCGTGCVASALFAARKFGYGSPVTVITRGGDLTVGFDDALEDVFLSGHVEIVYEGVLPMTLETG